MALTPPDGLRLLLLLCVVTLGLFGTALCSQPFPICDIGCCSCGDALQVTCDCTQQDSITLRKGDIPKGVKAIHIRNARTVVIDKDAVNDLKRLTNFSLHDINEVDIKENGMAFDKKSNIRSVKIQDIGALRIKRNAFSGLWETRTSISISRTTELHMETNGCTWRSKSLGPSLALQHVGQFNLHSKGFAAPLYSLSLDHVTMSTCHQQSFSGKIKSIQFNNVTIDEVKAKCFSDLGSLSTFTIKTSTMKTVRPQAFLGNIHELVIKNSRFTTMNERSLDIQTVSMQIISSYFKHLNTNALSVMAEDLRLVNIRVEFLAKHALAGLRIERSGDGYSQPLVIRNLIIPNAESGSLVFSDCAEILMTELNITAPWPHVCPTEQWARQLVGATASGPLNPAQFAVFMELFGMHLCTEDVRMPFPILTDERNPLCATRSSSPLDYFVYDDYDDNRDSLPDVSREDIGADTPRGSVDADSSHETGHNQPSRVAGVSSAATVSTASNAGSPGIAAASSVSVVPVQTEPLAEVDGGYSVKVAGDHPPEVDGGHLVEVDGGHSAEVDGSYRKPSPIEPRGEPAPASSDPVTGTTPPATEDQLMLYLSLGAMLVLIIVLGVMLLLLLFRRRSRGQQRISDLPQIEQQPITTSSSTLDSAPPSDANHLHEPIRQDLLQSPPPAYHQYESIRESRRLPPAYHQYEPIRPDLLPAGPPTPGPNPRISQYESQYAGSQLYASLLDR